MKTIYTNFLKEKGWTVDDYFDNTFPMMKIPSFTTFLERENISLEKYIYMSLPIIEHFSKSNANVDDFKHAMESTIITKLPDIISSSLQTDWIDNSSDKIVNKLVDSRPNKSIMDEFGRLQDHIVEMKTIQKGKDDFSKEIHTMMGNISKQLRTDIFNEQNSKIAGNKEEKEYEKIINCLDGFEVERVGTSPESMDLRLKSDDEAKPIVLLEIKRHISSNVSTKDVDKFRRDMISQESHGIMVATHKGIALKKDWQVDIDDNGKIALFLTRVNYDERKIISGLQLIYHMDSFLKENKNNKTISNSNIRLISNIMEQRAFQLEGLKRRAKDMKTLCELQMKELDTFLFDNVLNILRSTMLEVGEDDQPESSTKVPVGTLRKVCKECGYVVSGKSRPVLNSGMSQHKNDRCPKIGKDTGNGEGKNMKNDMVFKDVEKIVIETVQKFT